MTRTRIGIVSWNTAELLGECLDALPAAADGLDLDVVVVDNASTDASPDTARSRGVRVVENAQNLGYARGMNQALHGSDSDVLIALNPDTRPAPGSLRLLCDALLADDRVGLVVPRLVNPDGTPQHSVYRFPSPAVSVAASFVPGRLQRGQLGRRYCLEGAPSPDRAQDIDWAIGAVHVIRRSAIADLPPYDDRWFMYAEDIQLCWRLRAAGWRIRVEPDAAVVHVGNAAGAQAWGDGRTGRWVDATYEWYRGAHGAAATRRWAAVNFVAASWRLAPAAGRHLMRRPMAGWERDVRRALPYHLREAVGRRHSGDTSDPQDHLADA